MLFTQVTALQGFPTSPVGNLGEATPRTSPPFPRYVVRGRGVRP